MKELIDRVQEDLDNNWPVCKKDIQMIIDILKIVLLSTDE